MIKDIKIYKLSYQEHPFVHGIREEDEKDVWLTNRGTWSEIDGDPNCNIPLAKGVVIYEHL